MPYIISPYREIEMGSKARVSGHVKIKKVDRESRTTFQSEFNNLVLDEFLQNGMAHRANFAGDALYKSAGVVVGTGTQTTPQPGDTTLGNAIDSVVAGDSNSAYAFGFMPYSNYSGQFILGATPDDDYVTSTMVATFDYAQAVGNLTELGFLIGRYPTAEPTWASYSSNPSRYGLLTKTLIKDTQGNPVVLTKSSAEKLIVEYELRFYRPNPIDFTTNLNGQDIRIFAPLFGQSMDASIDFTDTLTNGGDRGVVGRDLWNPESDNSTDIDGEYDDYGSYTSMFHQLYKASHPAGANIATNSDHPDNTYYNDTTNNIHGSYLQIEPDTVDRTGNKIQEIFGYYSIFRGHQDNPAPCYLQSVAAGGYLTGIDARILDPATGQLKDFTLPGGYRLDLHMTYERTR